jgi:hypothetical protein
VSAPAPVLRREPATAVEHRCPLCGGTFAEETHCGVCPMTSYCRTLCCPNCGYSFVESSSVVDLVRRVVARLRGEGKGDRGTGGGRG